MIIVILEARHNFLTVLHGIDHEEWVVKRLIFKTTWLPDWDHSEGLMEGVQIGRRAALICLVHSSQARSHVFSHQLQSLLPPFILFCQPLCPT